MNVAIFTTIGTPNDETINGSSNPDWFLGKAGNDTLQGFAGNDGLFGSRGDDSLIGASGNERLRGGVGDDLLDSGIGNDRLVDGEDNDTLTGGSGSDRFLFQVGQGTDTITNFEDGVDYFLLAGGLTFEQLDITQSNNDTLINRTSNGEVLATLTGVSANLITQTDFVTI